MLGPLAPAGEPAHYSHFVLVGHSRLGQFGAASLAGPACAAWRCVTPTGPDAVAELACGGWGPSHARTACGAVFAAGEWELAEGGGAGEPRVLRPRAGAAALLLGGPVPRGLVSAPYDCTSCLTVWCASLP
jgi:hypothetical protein